jgi:hypothetical protein
MGGRRELLARGLFWNGATILLSKMPDCDLLLVLNHHRIGDPDGDSAILIANASSRTMNSTLAKARVTRAYKHDAARAAAEYGAEFRTDVEAFIDRFTIEAYVLGGVHERGALSSVRYSGFVDPAGSSGQDSFRCRRRSGKNLKVT